MSVTAHEMRFRPSPQRRLHHFPISKSVALIITITWSPSPSARSAIASSVMLAVMTMPFAVSTLTDPFTAPGWILAMRPEICLRALTIMVINLIEQTDRVLAASGIWRRPFPVSMLVTGFGRALACSKLGPFWQKLEPLNVGYCHPPS